MQYLRILYELTGAVGQQKQRSVCSFLLCLFLVLSPRFSRLEKLNSNGGFDSLPTEFSLPSNTYPDGSLRCLWQL